MLLNNKGVTAEEFVRRASEQTPIVHRAQGRERVQQEEQREGIPDMPIQFLQGERVEAIRGPSVHYIGDKNKIPTEGGSESDDECIWSNRFQWRAMPFGPGGDVARELEKAPEDVGPM
eukprot:4723127-Lingulodinium_polyedra.AAC.1